MTPTQEKWLREFAEALGWIDMKSEMTPWMGWSTGEHKEYKKPDWLVTPDGQDYLVQRAREKGRQVIVNYYPNNTMRKEIQGKTYASVEGLPGEKQWVWDSLHDQSSWAVAIAVCQALCPDVRLPEGE